MKSSNITQDEIISVLNSKINSSEYQKNLRMVDVDLLAKATIQLYNRLNFETFNANVLIWADKADVSHTYGSILATTIEEFFPDSCLIIDEKNLYHLEQLKNQLKEYHTDINGKILLVRNLKAEDPAKLSHVLTEFEKNYWTPSVILCATDEVISRLKNYTQQDSRLYHYLCGYKIFIPAFSAEDITSLVIQRLQNDNHTATESFMKKLDIYIRAVYPEAQLTEMEFVKDLIYRVYQTHYQKIVTSSELDETDVPYSKKAESLEKELENNAKDDSGKDINNDVSIVMVKSPEERAYDLSAYDFQKKNPTHNSSLHSQNNAGIFLVLSDYRDPGNNEIGDYYPEEDLEASPYKGFQTNDAPLEYLIDTAVTSGYFLKKIVCLTTPKVENPDPRTGVNAFDRFRYFVQSYAESVWGINDLVVESISYTGSLPPDQKYADFYQNLSQKTNDLQAFYMDYTGGLRDTSFLMVSTMRFLEFKGIKCEKVIYSDFHSTPKTIRNLNELYSLFQMINGMSEFVSSGTTRQLDEAFDNTNTMVSAIRRFANATNVGDLYNLDKYIKDLNYTLTITQDTVDAYSPDSQTLKNVMIDSMKDVIRTKLYGSTDEEKLILDAGTDDETINYYRLIDWCIDNKMYQQAATLYIEKVPIVYFKTGIISQLISLSSENPKGSSAEVTTFYKDLPTSMVIDKTKELFQEKLDEIIQETPDKKDLFHFANYKRMLKEKLSDFPEARDRFITIIENNYKEYSKATTITAGELEKYFPNGITWPKNLHGFVRQSSNNPQYIDYYLYNDAQFYLDSKETDDKKRTLAYIKKIFDHTVENQRTNDDKSLAILFAYYLAIKLLRNQMSHALESDAEKETKENLEEFLQMKTGKEIHISLEEEDISLLLRDAMTYTRTSKPFSLYTE